MPAVLRTVAAATCAARRPPIFRILAAPTVSVTGAPPACPHRCEMGFSACF